MSPRIFLAKCPPLEHMPVDFAVELRLMKQDDLLRMLDEGLTAFPELLARAVRNGSMPPLWKDVQEVFGRYPAP